MQRNNLDFDDDFARTIDSQENIPEFKPKKKWGEAEEEKDSAWGESKSDTSKATGAGWETDEKSDETKEGWGNDSAEKSEEKKSTGGGWDSADTYAEKKDLGSARGRNRTSKPANQQSPNSR